MSVSSESAEQMTKMILDGTEYTLKITGEASKELLVLIYAILKDNTKVRGKTRLTNLLKSGKSLKVFSLKQDELQIFMKEAKRYGVLYSALINKQDKDGMIDILVREEDAPKVNRIVERFELETLNVGKLKTEVNIPLQTQDKKHQSENSLKMSKGKEMKGNEEKKSIRKQLKKIEKERLKDGGGIVKTRILERKKEDRKL